jgi:2-hydroxychromene-2-carboxylate isomerase
MTEKPIVEFFFSPGSRYSYLAASQIPSIEAETGASDGVIRVRVNRPCGRTCSREIVWS